jgi:hypothetical protein
VRRTLALWLLLFGVYAATLGLGDHGEVERQYLIAAESLADQGDLGAADRYPTGLGFPLLILPAYEAGGTDAVELLAAALAALALVLAYRLALRVAPDPWALGAAAAAGLSAPLVAGSAAVHPELAAGAALAGAALLAIRLDERPGWRAAFGCFALLGALPWLGVRFLPAGVAIGVVAARALWRSRRRTLAVGSVELALFSVALAAGINEAVYDGPTPYSALPDGVSAVGSFEPGERIARLVRLFADPTWGLLRWAPVFALAFAGLWWLWRSRRDRLARALGGLHGVELTAGLCAAVLAVQLLVAALLAPTAHGDWFPGRHLLPALPLAVPLIAIGLRRAPRVGVVLAGVSLALSVWLYADARWDDGDFARATSHQLSTRPANTAVLSAYNRSP